MISAMDKLGCLKEPAFHWFSEGDQCQQSAEGMQADRSQCVNVLLCEINFKCCYTVLTSVTSISFDLSAIAKAWNWNEKNVYTLYLPFQCWGYFRSKHKDAIFFENHLNPVMLVFIR